MECRPATRGDIPETTHIITEGSLDYPLHIMLKPYLYRPDYYLQCLAVINRMLVFSYQWARHALVMEHKGQVVVTVLMHDHKVDVVRSFLNGGYEFFRYASPHLVVDFPDVTDRPDQIAIDNGDFDWYLEVLSVDASMCDHGVGRWLVSKVPPDFVAKCGGCACGLVTSTEENTRFYLNSGYEFLDRVDMRTREETYPIWAFQRYVELL